MKGCVNVEEKRREEMQHKFQMIDREKINFSGVEDVDSFDDDKIIAYTTQGLMTIKGGQLRINRLSVDSGELEIEGEVDSIEYADGHKSDKGGFLSKIFR